MSDSVGSHRRQRIRLPCPWDSPGKNSGVGCHFLLQCMKVKSESEVPQLCPTPSNPMDCSLPGSSVHGILQARVLEWFAIAFSILLTLMTTKRKARLRNNSMDIFCKIKLQHYFSKFQNILILMLQLPWNLNTTVRFYEARKQKLLIL